MLNIIYIGNKLYKQKVIMSVMETLIEQFESFAQVTSASDKKSIVGKVADITTTLLQHLRKADYVLIDVFSTKAFYFALWASLLSRLFNRKYILNLHGGNLPNRYSCSKWMFDYMLRHAHTITAPSKYLADYFTKAGYPTELIPNPIHIKDYPAAQAQLAVPSILYLRGYGKIYQPQLVIEAMKYLVETYPTAHVYMFGNDLDGGMKKCISLVEAYGLQKNVTIHGPTPKSIWIETAKNCNVCISVPSIDNTPVSVLEAMAMGLPVITTNVGGIKWMIDDRQNGLLADTNPKAIANKIAQLFQDKQLYQHIQQHATTYVATYDVQVVKQQWKKLLVENRK